MNELPLPATFVPIEQLEQMTADRDYALQSFKGMSAALSAALDRFNETGDEEGLQLVRSVLSEHFDREGLIQ